LGLLDGGKGDGNANAGLNIGVSGTGSGLFGGNTTGGLFGPSTTNAGGVLSGGLNVSTGGKPSGLTTGGLFGLNSGSGLFGTAPANVGGVVTGVSTVGTGALWNQISGLLSAHADKTGKHDKYGRGSKIWKYISEKLTKLREGKSSSDSSSSDSSSDDGGSLWGKISGLLGGKRPAKELWGNISGLLDGAAGAVDFLRPEQGASLWGQLGDRFSQRGNEPDRESSVLWNLLNEWRLEENSANQAASGNGLWGAISGFLDGRASEGDYERQNYGPGSALWAGIRDGLSGFTGSSGGRRVPPSWLRPGGDINAEYGCAKGEKWCKSSSCCRKNCGAGSRLLRGSG